MSDFVLPFGKPWRIAHRGDSANCPENTWASMSAALEGPIDGIETDIQMSSDGVPVIYHDRTLELIGQGKRAIRDLELTELKRFDVGAWFDQAFLGERLMTLEGMLTRHAQATRWLLEIKVLGRNRQRHRQLMDNVIDAVHQHGIGANAWILCFDLGLLTYGHERSPDLRFVLNQAKPSIMPKADFLAAYSVNIQSLTAEFCQSVHVLGKPVFTFTCNTVEDVEKARLCQADAIMADDPGWLAEQLAEEPVSAS